MRIALLKIAPFEGNLRHLNALFDYLKNKGVELREITLDPNNVQKVVEEIQEFRPAFTFDVNGTGIIVAEKDGQKKPLYDILGFIHVSIFVEEPNLHFPNLFGLEHQNLIALVTDVRYVESLRVLGIKNVSYITPFLEFSIFPEPEKERDIDVIFLGPVIDPQIIVDAVSKNLPEKIFPLFMETAEFMFRNPEVSVWHALDIVLSIFNPQFQEEFAKWRQEKPQDFLRMVNDIAMLATMRKRWFLISFLEGINLKIVGDFRGDLMEDHERIETKDHDELLKIFGRTRISILSFPHTVPSGIGITPLEVCAMASAPMIDFRGTLPGFLVPEKEVIPYLPLDRADIEEKILYYLDNPQEAEEIGKNAQKAVLDRYRVDDRAEFVYKTLKDIFDQATKQAQEKAEEKQEEEI